MGEDKIKSLEELGHIIENLKKEGKTVVHCHGCFDLVHYGHIQHFLSSKKQGDILVVTVTPDRFIQKGPGRPFFNEEVRLKYLANIDCIDYVALNKWETAVETIKLIKPDIYSKGKEVLHNNSIDEVKTGSINKSNLDAEIEVVKSINGKLHLTDEITFSSSNIINKINPIFSDEEKIYLENLKNKFNPNEIIGELESLKNIKVLAIGDAILDNYVFCQSLEKSGKEPLVSHKLVSSETNLGGIFAIANHLAGFTKNINVLTCIGKNTYEFIEKSLDKSIERTIFVQSSSQTLVKKKYMESYKLNKLFSIYNTDELRINEETEEKILRFLEKNISRFDMILVGDFGHGIITPKLLDYLCNSDKFLAVNCQFNAGNLGYNFITKYKRANFVSLNEREIRLPLQEKSSNIKIPILKLNKDFNIKKINITLGKSGIIYYCDGKFFSAPSFVKEPLDTIGSGDAVFSLTSLLAYNDSEPEFIPFLGNCIGGLATRIIGNKSTVSPIELKKFISYIMR